MSKAIVPVVFVKVSAPAVTAPLKVVPSELLIVRSPPPVKVVPVIAPVVPLFNVSALPPLVTAPTLNAAPVPVLFVNKLEVPPKVIAPILIGLLFV